MTTAAVSTMRAATEEEGVVTCSCNLRILVTSFIQVIFVYSLCWVVISQHVIASSRRLSLQTAAAHRSSEWCSTETDKTSSSYQAGFMEEFLKYVAVMVAMKRQFVVDPRGVVSYALAAAVGRLPCSFLFSKMMAGDITPSTHAGFSMVENVVYVLSTGY